MSAPTPAVALERVSFRYPGASAGVFDVTLDIAPGELVVCIGPSGCGKTTLLKLIAGFLRPDAGAVRLAGEEVTLAPVRARECGVVFQSYALFPHMSVRDNVAYALRVRDVPLADRHRRADAMLELVGLAGMGERLPAQLSGGQQQRVALARALVFRPRALLLDEPLSALDAATRVAMRDEVRRIQRQQGIASLLITHDQDEALSLADRVAVLREGRLVQLAPPQALYDRPADAFVAGFVGRANILDGEIRVPGAVDTPIGRLIAGDAAAAPRRVRVLIRPERVLPTDEAARDNVFPVRVLHDRFYGLTRELELAVGAGVLKCQTAMRGPVAHVHVPRDAVQFLPAT